MKIILGLVGQIAAGKGTISQYAKQKYHASIYTFSDAIKDVLVRLHIPINRKNLQLISTLIRQNFGEDTFAKIIAENVKKDTNNIIVVDGIRRMADIKYLSANKNFKLVSVHTNAEIRYSRQLLRNEKLDDQGKTYQEFLEDQKREADAEIPRVMEEAKIKINNNGTFAELLKQIDNIIK